MASVSRRTFLTLCAGALSGAVLWAMGRPRGPDPETLARLYATPLPIPTGPLNVYHLGHSLVGRDMPSMLAQLAPPGHRYASQLGWGTPLRAHWEPDVPINGFETENDHPQFRAAEEAVGSGDYNAVILTEMVEIRDAIRSHDSARYLALWAGRAQAANPATRVYLYETWPHIETPAKWLSRLEQDLGRHWEGDILLPALADGALTRPIYLIPAGQAMARFLRRVEAAGGIDGIIGPRDLFAVTPEGASDPIHLNDMGAYLVALTHYAVLYHRSPVGLPHQLLRADGTPAAAPGATAARRMQEAVWETVRAYPKTGVAA